MKEEKGKRKGIHLAERKKFYSFFFHSEISRSLLCVVSFTYSIRTLVIFVEVVVMNLPFSRSRACGAGLM